MSKASMTRLGPEMVGDGLADHLTVPSVDHYRQVDPALIAGYSV
jgi:hypothetical protein